MRRPLAVGLSCILAATVMLPNGETRPVQPTPPTVTVEYLLDDVAWRFKPLIDDTHRVLTELFAEYGIHIRQGPYRSRPGYVRVELLGDTTYKRSLPQELAPYADRFSGYALSKESRALVRVGKVYLSIDHCPGGAVADAAEIAAHEIGHVLGLAHLETKELGVTTLNLMDDVAGLELVDGDVIPPYPRVCTIAPEDLRGADLDASLTPQQAMILRDATQGGMVWDLLYATQDFSTYTQMRKQVSSK